MANDTKPVPYPPVPKWKLEQAIREGPFYRGEAEERAIQACLANLSKEKEEEKLVSIEEAKDRLRAPITVTTVEQSIALAEASTAKYVSHSFARTLLGSAALENLPFELLESCGRRLYRREHVVAALAGVKEARTKRFHHLCELEARLQAERNKPTPVVSPESVEGYFPQSNWWQQAKRIHDAQRMNEQWFYRKAGIRK